MSYPLNEEIFSFHLALTWISIALGILSGAVMGMLFHRENWLGGYGSTARRMIRLGHISFFGMAFLNITYALTLFMNPNPGSISNLGSWGLLIATVTMPLACFLSAKRGIERTLFFVPVAGTFALTFAVAGILIGK